MPGSRKNKRRGARGTGRPLKFPEYLVNNGTGGAVKHSGKRLERLQSNLFRDLRAFAQKVSSLMESHPEDRWEEVLFEENSALLSDLVEVGVAIDYLPWAPTWDELGGRSESPFGGVKYELCTSGRNLSGEEVAQIVLDATKDQTSLSHKIATDPSILKRLFESVKNEPKGDPERSES
ncbi:MAG: hypothetical protein DHS20C15_26190 [Planctomycetota bacterium]|nr:MAG: hypothetical protein DHS20C15_26190 [Planctomycetota bacterium]